MSKTPFSKKVEILAQVWISYKDSDQRDEGWLSFFEWHDISLPLAYFAHNGYATINRDKAYFIDDAWREYCVMLGIDPSDGYLDMRHTFDASVKANA